MFQIHEDAVKQNLQQNGNDYPVLIDLYCPFCNVLVGFNLSWANSRLNNNCTTTGGRCPRCQKISNFIIVDITTERKIFVHPEPAVRNPLANVDEIEQFSPALKRAYRSAFNAYNHEEWAVSAVACGRALEGIVKALISPKQLPKCFVN